MCTKAEARAAHELRTGAIDRFAQAVDALPPLPAMTTDSPMTRAIGEVARIYENAATRLARRRRHGGK